LGKKLMEDIKEALVDGAVIEQQPRLEGET